MATRRRLSDRLYRLALRAFPRRHRRAYADEMVETFRHQLDARGRGRRARFVAAALVNAVGEGFGERRRHRRARLRRGALRLGMSWLDVKLGARMLARFPGLSIAGGLALAIAIGIGAGWYDFSRDLFRPELPLPGGDRLVEVEMRNAATGLDEHRLMHEFTAWRDGATTLVDLGAYRSLERNLILDGAAPEPVTVAETTASAFAAAGVPALMGRTLAPGDERAGAPPVVVIGYAVWQRRFAGRPDVVGHTVDLGRQTTTIVGVMPEGFAFPINHRLWVPLRERPSGHAPLEGPPVRIFGRLAPGVEQAQAYAELLTFAERAAAASPGTHQHLRPRVLAYGGQSPGDRSWLEFILTHLPILLVLLVACANVGTLIYARTATRDAEIATRYALGAGRGRIVGQLFVEALVLAAIAAAAGLTGAHVALRWGVAAFYSGQTGGAPFWIDPGLDAGTVLYAALMTITGAAILGMLPAIKATRAQVHSQLKNLGAGGSTLRFGRVWTGVMIGQVALTVFCIPPAMGIAHEAWRDRAIRDQFPAGQYLTARLALDREIADGESDETFASRFARTYAELERRIGSEPGVSHVTFGDRLPGMSPAVRGAEFERAPGDRLVIIPNLWMTSTGPGFFEAFDVALVSGRGFHNGDRSDTARTALVNEAFARRYGGGTSPVGRRVRFASDNPDTPETWLEIVGVVADIGMTPTDLGEAPYLYRAASVARTFPLVIGVRAAGDPADLAPRLRAIAADIDPGLRLDEMQRLDDAALRIDVPNMIAAGALAAVVGLGLFLSAAGIFALMSVSVARRTREIGLRSALGASSGRLLAGIFSRAATLVGGGILAGNLLLLLIVAIEPEVELSYVAGALMMTSSVMLAVGLLACVQPARRALRIHPTAALKET